MDITDDHFALFGLPRRFAVDADALDGAYRDLQRQVHPDRFASATPAEQRVALQWATRANEAHRTLRDPLRRAAYLCTLQGVDPAAEAGAPLPHDFLVQQMAWREALDDADGDGAFATLERERVAKRDALVSDVAAALDAGDDAARAAALVREWMFVEKFGDDIAAARDGLAAKAA